MRPYVELARAAESIDRMEPAMDEIKRAKAHWHLRRGCGTGQRRPGEGSAFAEVRVGK
jgi:hypothetical protein